jgi:hypothetical protein
MTLQYGFQPNGVFFAAANPFESAFSQVAIFQIVQVFEDGFADIVGFGAPSAPGQFVQAFFDGLWKPNG